MKIKTNRLFSIFTGNGFITFTSTIIGVFVGIYLTDFYNRQSQLKARDDAFKQVSKEISTNADLLKDYRDTLQISFERLNYFNTKLNNDLKIIIHKDSLLVFKNKLKGVLTVENTALHNSDSIQVRGDLNLNINSNLILFDLQTVIWSTFKQTDYLSLTPFDCISNIESIYNLFNDFNTSNLALRNNLLDGKYMTDKQSIALFLKDFKKILFKHEILINMCDANKNLFEDCSG